MKTKSNAHGKKVHEFLSLDDVDNITKLLNEALSDEWLTYYQSWIGAILMEGPMRDEIKPELFIHANQELNHALLIKTRMLELGVVPKPAPPESRKTPPCQPPVNPYIEEILHQNMKNEIASIQRYRQISDLTYGKDQKTYQLIVNILNEELQHAEDLEKWVTDIQVAKVKMHVHAMVNVVEV